MLKLTPIPIDVLYVKTLLGACQTCSWGFIKKDVPKVDQANCSYCPFNTVSPGDTSLPMGGHFQAGIRALNTL